MPVDVRARKPPVAAPSSDVTGSDPARSAGRASRAGMFVAGYFMLLLLNSVFWGVVGVTREGSGRPQSMLTALAAGSVMVGLLLLAARLRGGDLEPFAVMAVLGGAEYIVVAVTGLGRTVGLEGTPLLWTVLLVSVPAVLALLIWLPHPILGISVGVGVVIAVVMTPGAFGVATRSLAVGVIAVLLAAVVDLRTRSRAGSCLHYLGVAGFAIGTIAALAEVGTVPGLAVAANFAMFELLIAIVMRRRSWAYIGWLTWALGIAELIGGTLGGLGIEFNAFELGAPLVVLSVLWMRRHEEPLRTQLLASLPPGLVERFPA